MIHEALAWDMLRNAFNAIKTNWTVLEILYKLHVLSVNPSGVE